MQMQTLQQVQTGNFSPVDYVRHIVAKGGPVGNEIKKLQEAVNAIRSKEDIVELNIVLHAQLTLDTMVGHTYLKPYGYAGDFEIIEKIYAQKRHANAAIDAWDQFYHSLDACDAVRNRKKYFKEVMVNALASGAKNVLILGSGPCTDLFEYLTENPANSLQFTCVDIDATAIKYASEKNAAFMNQITFVHRNIFRYTTTDSYDLVWSAGLFDYLSDEQFVFIIKKMRAFLTDKGKMIIGNFSENNPSQYCMEVMGDWYLNHRSPALLTQLGVHAGFEEAAIRVEQEELGINLFVHYNTL
ncbi:MAG: class I SAM-dependent methyltransferase [Chitinophagaceae bacterium]|nr:MAG: class I SAM-dependent methyltransferase [Chitinophagaceae bacterium]